jgi:hypothetical protein
MQGFFSHSLITFLFTFIINQNKSVENNSLSMVPAPNVIVYQLNGEWQNLVPVTLSKDKSTIVAYPSSIDLERMPTPIQLKHNWWLDMRGISKNTAFLNVSIEEYKTWKETPPLSELMSKVKVLKPFKRIYNCGNFQINEESLVTLNKQLRKNSIKKCSCLK